jgi:hypothetical protein
MPFKKFFRVGVFDNGSTSPIPFDSQHANDDDYDYYDDVSVNSIVAIEYILNIPHLRESNSSILTEEDE